jgi:hypothetical protein
LRPSGRLIDIHPVAEASPVEIHRGTKTELVGNLIVKQWCIDYQEADKALAEITRRGLFAVEREGMFDSLTHYGSLPEMHTSLLESVDKFAREAGSTAEAKAEVEARAARAEELSRPTVSGAELTIRERIHIRRFRPT